MTNAELCTCGKQRYISRSEARLAARIEKGRGRGKNKLRVYQCEGGYYHLTSKSTSSTTYLRELESRDN